MGRACEYESQVGWQHATQLVTIIFHVEPHLFHPSLFYTQISVFWHLRLMFTGYACMADSSQMDGKNGVR
jgi:hypothetical protein